MKNTLKKVLCTALVAVSLSASVTVPSSLNKPNSDNAIVNVMEADAKISPYDAYLTNSEHYYVRSSKSKKNDSNIIRKDLYGVFTVYEETKDWVRISPDGQKEEWVWRNRVRKVDNSISSDMCTKLHGYSSRRRTGYSPDKEGIDFYAIRVNGKKVQYCKEICTKCGQTHWKKY